MGTDPDLFVSKEIIERYGDPLGWLGGGDMKSLDVGSFYAIFTARTVERIVGLG